MDAAARANSAAYADALRAEEEEARRTPEDRLVEAVREIWQNHPEQRGIIEALVAYAEARTDTDDTRRCA